MEPNSEAHGIYSKVVQVRKAKSKFQVYRDRDWEQALYPETEEGDMSCMILGPDGNGLGNYWVINCEAGDKVRVDFQRSYHEGRETRQISWKKVGFESIDLEAVAKTQKWHVVGSFSDYSSTVEMERDGDGNYYGDIVVGFSGQETFQLALNGNLLCALYPRVDNSTMFDESGALEGPGPDGAAKFWCVGLHPEDACGPGTYARIHLEMDGCTPKRVWWERHDTEDSHRLYLAQGAWNTMDRHCRMLGFIPYMAKHGTPAKLVGKPDFLSLKAGETMTATKSVPGVGLQPGVNIVHPLEGKFIG
jgi:hypothetical protein